MSGHNAGLVEAVARAIHQCAEDAGAANDWDFDAVSTAYQDEFRGAAKAALDYLMGARDE